VNPFNPEGLAVGARRASLRIETIQLPTQHHRDDLVVSDVSGLAGADHPAIAKDRDSIRNRSHLRHPVRDIQDQLPSFGASCRNLQQPSDFAGRQSGARLVEDQDIGVGSEGLRDFDELPLSYG
jgi:hypothetical protein